ncbi:MAG: cysteine desulfurase-like protein [Ilumatobacteraceae bacterium]
MTFTSLRHRFPGAQDGWARFDGPAGTQVVDSAITAMTDWLRDGSNSCGGGYFSAAEKADALQARTREAVGRLFDADPEGVVFGPNMTTLTFAFSRAVGATLRPGDRVVGTRLDHEANVSTWRLAAAGAGAEHVLAPFDAATGTLPPQHVIDLIDERTRWVTLPGASNLLGTAPDLAPIIEAAHAVGARVFVDAVALAPHRRISISTLGCDALASSPYKWYAPHSGMLWVRPEVLEELPAFKVKPAYDHGPKRWETGMPNYEALAGIEATARFLLEEGMDRIEAAETALFAPLLDGLLAISGVTLYGVHGLEGRTPTAAFTVDGHSPAAVCKAFAAERIAAWDGNNYAVEVVETLGLAESGGVVRVGISRYNEPADGEHLLAVVRRRAAG